MEKIAKIIAESISLYAKLPVYSAKITPEASTPHSDGYGYGVAWLFHYETLGADVDK
jgi:hypothetical protein